MKGDFMKETSNYQRDEWSGFADLLANLIEKYVVVLNLDNLPDPPVCLEDALKENEKQKLNNERN